MTAEIKSEGPCKESNKALRPFSSGGVGSVVPEVAIVSHTAKRLYA
jgi:hypothetical protein